MALVWGKVLDPSDSDYYPARVPQQWLNGESIANVTFVAPPEAGLNISDAQSDGEIVRALISGTEGVTQEGKWPIEITVTTASGRRRQQSVNLRVKQL